MFQGVNELIMKWNKSNKKTHRLFWYERNHMYLNGQLSKYIDELDNLWMKYRIRLNRKSILIQSNNFIIEDNLQIFHIIYLFILIFYLIFYFNILF